MNWYKHDTGATQDAKIRKLIIKYGPIGYAIYFHCLELIAAEISESNLTFELEHDSEIIADNLHVKGTADQSGVQIVEEIMRYIIELNLFQENNGRVFCFKLLKRLDLSMTSNAKFREMITQAKENHDAVMMPSCKNHDTIMQDKIRLDKIRIEIPGHSSDIRPPESETELKIEYARFVKLTESEYSDLYTKHTKKVIDLAIEILSAYKEAKGKRYKSDAGAIRQWGIRAALERIQKNPAIVTKNTINGYATDDHVCGYCNHVWNGTMNSCPCCGWETGDEIAGKKEFYERNLARKKVDRRDMP